MTVPYTLFIPSSRDARFTVSPMAVYSKRRSPPIFPITASPVLIPTPMPSGGRPSFFHSSFNFSNSFTHLRAIIHPFFGWSERSRGALQRTIMASPIYLFNVPPSSRTMLVIGLRYSFNIATNSSGESFSDKDVNPLISENKVVISLFSPPSFSLSGSFNISETSSGETISANAFFR